MSESSFETTEMVTWYIPQLFGKDGLNVEKEIVVPRTSKFKTNYFDLKMVLKFSNFGSNEPRIKYFFLCRDKVHLKSVRIIHFSDNDFKTNHDKFYDNSTIQPNQWYHLCTTKNARNRNLSTSYWKSITLHFTMIIKGNTEIAQRQKSEAEEHTNFLQKSRLISDFENLLRLGTFSDAVIKSTDGNEFKVHKAFLSSRSDVLKAHFEHNTLESITNVLESPFESKVLEEVLTFIYTDQSSKVSEMPEILLKAATFYQLDRLKSLSEEALYKKINVENAIEILTRADMHSCTHLEKLLLEFIEANITLVMKTQGWLDFNSAEKIKLIFDNVMKKNKK